MADVEIQWTVPDQSHADIVLGYDPTAVDANGNVTVTSASGTYQVLDGSGNVIRTDQVTGLIAPNSFLFAPDDKVNVLGRNPIVDTSGLGVLIDNASDADQIGPNNTPEVELSTDIFGDYRELGKGDATGVTLNQSGSSTQPTGGSGGGGPGGGGSSSGGSGSSTGDGVSVTERQNGSFVYDITMSGQTVTSAYDDIFYNHAVPETTFVFEPGHGQDVVGLFRIGGSDHDTLSFLGSDFGDTPQAQLGALLDHARNTKGGLVITDPTSHDSVRLAGLTKVQLVHNERDILFR